MEGEFGTARRPPAKYAKSGAVCGTGRKASSTAYLSRLVADCPPKLLELVSQGKLDCLFVETLSRIGASTGSTARRKASSTAYLSRRRGAYELADFGDVARQARLPICRDAQGVAVTSGEKPLSQGKLDCLFVETRLDGAQISEQTMSQGKLDCLFVETGASDGTPSRQRSSQGKLDCLFVETDSAQHGGSVASGGRNASSTAYSSRRRQARAAALQARIRIRTAQPSPQ